MFIANSGNIAIANTSIPGVLLANNEPGQQDPRRAHASSITVGAKPDVRLDGEPRRSWAFLREAEAGSLRDHK